MRTRSEAAPLLKRTLARLGLSLAVVIALPVAAQAADPLVPLSAVYDTRMLLTLGITLGIIAFSIGSAIACLQGDAGRAQGARRGEPRGRALSGKREHARDHPFGRAAGAVDLDR